MERIYVRALYLKTLHYFFFALAVFSMTGGMMFFNFMALESINFIVLAAFYFAASMIIAYYYYRDYKETVEPIMVVRLYLFPYIALVLWTIGSMTFLVFVFPFIIELINSFLFVNYYIFFIIIIGFILSRFRIVTTLFEVYSRIALNNAKRIAKQYANFVDVGEYKIGSSPEIDEIFDDIGSHKDYPLPYVRKLEIALCDRHIVNLNRLMERMRHRKLTKSEERLMRNFEVMKDNYLEKIKKIEQKVD